MTNQLEDELKEIKTVTAAALPRTGAELEVRARAGKLGREAGRDGMECVRSLSNRHTGT